MALNDLGLIFGCALVVVLIISGYRENKQATARKKLVELQMNMIMEEYQTPPDWHERRRYVLERDHFRCSKCDSTNTLHVHHIIPRHIHRDHSVRNLITLCYICHGKEHNNQFLSNDERNLRLQLKSLYRYGKQVRARKTHACACCHGFIVPSELYTKVTSKDIPYSLRYLCGGDDIK